MKKLFAVLTTVLVLAVSGCAPQVDVEAEAAAIREAIDVEWLKAAQAKDVEGWLSFYTDDALMLPPNTPIATGKEAIRALLSELVANPGFAINLQTTQVEVSRAGDLAYSLNTYELTLNDPEGKPVTERGKGVFGWKKQPDGTWKVVIDIWNSDGPVASE